MCAPDTLCQEVGITSLVGSHQWCRKPIMWARHVSLLRTQCAAGASHHVQHSVPSNTPAIPHVHGVYDDAGATMRPARIACLTVFCVVLMMGAASGDTAAARPDPDTSEKKAIQSRIPRRGRLVAHRKDPPGAPQRHPQRGPPRRPLRRRPRRRSPTSWCRARAPSKRRGPGPPRRSRPPRPGHTPSPTAAPAVWCSNLQWSTLRILIT